MSKPTLYLMFGYPGAGKTTTAEVISQLTGAAHISSDHMREELFPGGSFSFSQADHDKLYNQLDQLTEQLLAEGKDVIYDANLNRHKHRQDKYDICERTGATPKLLWVQTPKEIAKERAMHESRRHLWPGWETASQLFDRIAGVLEKPKDDEPYTTIDGTKVTPEYIRECLNL